MHVVYFGDTPDGEGQPTRGFGCNMDAGAIRQQCKRTIAYRNDPVGVGSMTGLTAGNVRSLLYRQGVWTRVYQKIKIVSYNSVEVICPGGMFHKGYKQKRRPQNSKSEHDHLY